jgi:hypothetical protein
LAITAAMRAAGKTFRNHCKNAHHEQLRAADLLRSGGGREPSEPGLKTEAAREQVWRAIIAVGGLASAGGACLWHVVGLELSLKQWALEQGWSGRRVTQETACGIMIAALGTLEAHLDGRGVARDRPGRNGGNGPSYGRFGLIHL